MTTITRTHSASKRSLKATAITPSMSVCAFMVRLDWTSRQVVKVTAHTGFNLRGKMVASTRHIVCNHHVYVPAGQVLFFVASEELPGWYYVSDGVGCSCPGCKNSKNHTCKHLKAIAEPPVEQVEVPEVSTIQPTPVAVEATTVGEQRASMTPQEWKAMEKRNKAWQKAEKAKDLAKLAAVKQASAA
ncbi:MAG TPA: hypothetical protein VKR06_46080 [Ktedonosporobacter sp.]|nr:hypothetical protein [Ktedonosporobacter sp.]